jgi:hypothetical protein
MGIVVYQTRMSHVTLLRLREEHDILVIVMYLATENPWTAISTLTQERKEKMHIITATSPSGQSPSGGRARLATIGLQDLSSTTEMQGNSSVIVSQRVVMTIITSGYYS